MAPIDGEKRKRGRPSNATKATRVEEQQPRKRRARARPASVELVDNGVSEAPFGGGSKHRKGRRDDYDSVAKYQSLAPTTCGVPRHTIDTKWEPLPVSAISRISQLLNDVERSVVMRLQDDRKRTQASTAVQMVSRRLHRKLTRGQPFPPSTRSMPEEDFDFEKILDSSRALESQLTPALHSIELLKTEKAKEEALIEAEATALEDLEANAKAEASRRKRAEKTLHDILRDEDDAREEQPAEDSYWTSRKSQQRLLDLANADEDLQPITRQLYNHLESIESNADLVKGLPSAMDGSRAALQDVLFKHVGRIRYEQVILG